MAAAATAANAHRGRRSMAARGAARHDSAVGPVRRVRRAHRVCARAHALGDGAADRGPDLSCRAHGRLRGRRVAALRRRARPARSTSRSSIACAPKPASPCAPSPSPRRRRSRSRPVPGRDTITLGTDSAATDRFEIAVGGVHRASSIGRRDDAGQRDGLNRHEHRRDLRSPVAFIARPGRHELRPGDRLPRRHRRRPVPADSIRGAGGRPGAGTVDHRIGARAVRRHGARPARRLLAPHRGQGARSARRAGRLVQHHDRPADAAARRDGREEAARGGAAHRAQHPDVAAAAGAGADARPDHDRALLAGARGRRRLLRLPSARREADRHPDRGRVGQGHVGGALHGGAQGTDAVAVANPPIAARAPDRGGSDHRGQSRQPQLHHDDLRHHRPRDAHDDLRAGRTHAA